MKGNGMLQTSLIRAGRWEGLWLAAQRPDLHLMHRNEILPGLDIIPAGEGQWQLVFALPVERISEGVQTFLLCQGAETVGQFWIQAGEAVEADLPAEIALLRAELDLLKQAFRRHCAAQTP